MIKMKKIIFIFLSCILIFALTACGRADAQHSDAVGNDGGTAQGNTPGVKTPGKVDEVILTTAFLLEQMALKKEAVEINLEVEGAAMEEDANGTAAQLTNAKVEFCTYPFHVRLKFDGSGILYGFDCFLSAEQMQADAVYTLAQDLSALLTEAYSEPRTYPDDSNIQNWTGAADVDAAKKSVDRWLVDGEWELPGYKGEDLIMQAQLCYYAELEQPYIAVSYDLIVHRLNSYELEHGIAL